MAKWRRRPHSRAQGLYVAVMGPLILAAILYAAASHIR